MSSPLTLFCALEAEYIQMIYPGFKNTILTASNFSVLDIRITSVLRQNSTRICDALASQVPAPGTQAHRLLESTTYKVSITFVAMAQEPYALVLDWLFQEGVTGVSIVTALAAAELCDRSTSQSHKCFLLAPPLFDKDPVSSPSYPSAHDPLPSKQMPTWLLILLVMGVASGLGVVLCVFARRTCPIDRQPQQRASPLFHPPIPYTSPYQHYFQSLPPSDQLYVSTQQ